MKKLTAILFPALFSVSVFTGLSSCQSSNAFRVPGESSIITKNISSEYFAIAEAYLNLKNYEKAIQYYKLAMKNKSLRLSSYYKLARCYALAKDYENSAECYENLLNLDPDNKDLQLSLAYVNGMAGNTDKALVQYESLTQKYPNDSSVLENYISILLFLEKAEEAQKQYAILAEKFPDNANLSSISQKITDLAEKLQKSAEPENTDKEITAPELPPAATE